MPKLTRLLFVFFLAFAPVLAFTSTTQAEPLEGLGVDVYTFSQDILPNRQPYSLCETDTVWTSVPNVDADWGGDIVAGCQGDFVLIHYSGYLISPNSSDVTFQSWADDGFWFSLDDVPVIDDWVLKGCSGSSASVALVANQSYKFDAWWYEYGGGACNRLFWDVDGSGLTVVPPSAFSREVLPVVEPPVVEPPIVPIPEPTIVPEPPVVPEPPIIEPPIVEPPIVEPPIIEPPIVPIIPPVIEKPIIEKPIVAPVVKPIDVPPVVEPIVEKPIEKPVIEPEPKPTITDIDLASIDPQALSDEDVALLTEDALKTFETAVEGSLEYNQALQQLMIVAQADDIVVSKDIANVPVLGATIVGLTNAFNALGNFGADMSPKARHKAKQEVVAAVIVTQIATTAVGLTVSAPSSIRRIK